MSEFKNGNEMLWVLICKGMIVFIKVNKSGIVVRKIIVVLCIVIILLYVCVLRKVFFGFVSWILINIVLILLIRKKNFLVIK